MIYLMSDDREVISIPSHCILRAILSGRATGVHRPVLMDFLTVNGSTVAQKSHILPRRPYSVASRPQILRHPYKQVPRSVDKEKLSIVLIAEENGRP